MFNNDQIYGKLENAFNDVNCVAMEIELKDGEIIDIVPKMLNMHSVSGIDSYGFRTSISFNEINNVKPLYDDVKPLHEIIM